MNLNYQQYTALQSRCIGACIALSGYGRMPLYGPMFRVNLANRLWWPSCHEIGKTPWDPQ